MAIYKPNCKIAVTLLLAASLPLAAEDNSDKRPVFRLGFDFTTGAVVNNSSMAFSSLPSSIRTVPTHPQDPQSWKMVIPNQTFETGSKPTYGLARFSPMMIIADRLLLQGGPAGPIFTSQQWGPVYQINQNQTTDRGYGKSLVDDEFLQTWPTIPGWYGQAELKLHKRFWLMAGYAQNKTKFEVRQGYDRFDKYEYLRTLPVAEVKTDMPYFGVVVPILTNTGSGSRAGYQISLETFVGQSRVKSLTAAAQDGPTTLASKNSQTAFGFNLHVRLGGKVL